MSTLLQMMRDLEISQSHAGGCLNSSCLSQPATDSMCLMRAAKRYGSSLTQLNEVTVMCHLCDYSNVLSTIFDCEFETCIHCSRTITLKPSLTKQKTHCNPFEQADSLNIFPMDSESLESFHLFRPYLASLTV